MGESGSESPAAGERGPIARLIRGIDRGVEYAEAFLIAGSVIVMALVMVGHVLGRTFFRMGIPGVTEITELLIILMTFVGVSYAVRRARHISMSAIYDQLTGVARKGMLIIICVFTGALLFFLAWESLGYTQTIYGRGRSTSALNIPLWMIYIVLPIGLGLGGIQYWLTALRNLTTREMYRSFTEKEAYDEVPDEAAMAMPSGGEEPTTADSADAHQPDDNAPGGPRQD